MPAARYLGGNAPLGSDPSHQDFPSRGGKVVYAGPYIPSVAELLQKLGEGNGKTDDINGYRVRKSDSSWGGFVLANETTGEIIAPQDGWEKRFSNLKDAVKHAKSLPSIRTWEEEVEAAGIPLSGVGGVKIVKSYSLFVVSEETRWGLEPIKGQATWISNPGYRNVQGAILFFWEWLESQAKSKKPAQLVNSTNDVTSEGEKWILRIFNSQNPKLLFPQWCLEGHQPSLFWSWLEWFGKTK